jgi:tRNA A-37 threonylcarbamoyl transferase component Bud32
MEKCLKMNVKYKPGEKIGDRQVYIDDSGKYIMKITEIDTKFREKMFDEEIEIGKLAAKIGVTFPIVDHWKCKGKTGYGVTIQERLEITLEEYIKKFGVTCQDVVAIILQIEKIIEMLGCVGIVHNDLHIGNIMLDDRPNPIKLELSTGTKYLYVIDFDMSIIDPNISSEEPTMETVMAKQRDHGILFENTVMELLKKIKSEK